MSLGIHQALPIFADAAVTPDSYHVFEKSFSVTAPAPGAILEIAADSTFEVALNGRVLPLQQLADFPERRTFSRLDVSDFLTVGDNRIVCRVHYMGEDFLTCQKAVPYLQLMICAGETMLAKTDCSWRCAPDTAYVSGRRSKVTRQLGFTFEYRAENPAPVLSMPVKIAPVTGTLSLRRVPQLRELPRTESVLHCFGILRREREEAEVALTCMRDLCAPRRIHELFAEFDRSQITEQYVSEKFRLPGDRAFVLKPLAEFPGADGYFVIADLGRETAGYLTLDLEAPAGTVIDITHGEHLDDGRVRSYVGQRCFGDRYCCHAGRNRFTCRHRRLGARYLELHITRCGAGRVALYDVGLIPLEIPLPEEAAFTCEDTMIRAHNALAIRTLKLCMHEHYEDCPWREQGLYGYDSRNQMLFGYYVWGNYDFAAASLELLGNSYDGERYLTLTAPGRVGRSIPSFTMAWISALYEHALFSGSPELFRRRKEQIDRILDRALADPAPGRTDLYCSGDSAALWNFYEWRGVLSRLDIHPQSPYNLYLAEALRSAGRLHEFFGDPGRAAFLLERADAVVEAVRRNFFDPVRGGFALAAEPVGEKLFEHVQALMLFQAELPEEQRSAVLTNLENHTMHPVTLSALFYLLRGLLHGGERGRRLILPRLRAALDPILLAGATSLWETSAGGDDFDGAGSLCHAWSGVYPYFSGRILLGVRPLTPGFAAFEVNPVPCGLTHAAGEVPAPAGKIKVSWRLDGAGKPVVEVVKPAGLTCVPGPDIAELRVIDAE